MVTDISHWERVDAESVVLAVIAAETVFRYAVAIVATALLPRSVFGLPALSTIISPSGLLLVHAGGAALLDGPVVLLSTAGLLPLILVRSSMALLIRRIILALTLLLALIVTYLSLRLTLSCRVILPPLLRLPLLILLLLGHMLLLPLCIFLLLLPSCILSAVGLLVWVLLILLAFCLPVILSYRFRVLLLSFSGLVLFLRFFLFLLLVVRILA